MEIADVIFVHAILEDYYSLTEVGRVKVILS